VVIQLKKKPNARYRILGVALVARWESGYFIFEGFSREGIARTPAGFAGRREQERQLALIAEGGLEPALLAKAEESVMRQIRLRRGQRAFRANLLSAYAATCAMSQCDAEPALEAAHIIPYREAANNHVSNGLLLRADLHTLFDLRLISVDAGTGRVLIANELKETSYRELAGSRLNFPKKTEHHPSFSNLEMHRMLAGL
jgi:predicted restriction endonuclease